MHQHRINLTMNKAPQNSLFTFFRFVVFVFANLFLANAYSNSTAKIEPSMVNPEIGKPYVLNFTFADTGVGCGMAIDWGDGKIDRLRFGEEYQIKPPYSVQHTYNSEGQFTIKINGELLIRGLRSVLPCDVKNERIVKVLDPVLVLRQAEEKAIADAQLKERLEAARIINEARLKAEADERARLDALNQANLRERLSRASVKSCAEFMQLFNDKYKDKGRWPSLQCNTTNSHDAVFVITGINPNFSPMHRSAQYFYQPNTETVLEITSAGVRTVYRASNFINVNESTDMNSAGRILMENLPVNQQREVCNNIKQARDFVRRGLDFRSAVSNPIYELGEQGNWNFEIIRFSDVCRIKIDISGQFRGTSHSKSTICEVNEVERGDGKSFIAVSTKKCR